MSHDDRDAPEQVHWQGKYIVAKTRGRWEDVSRTRGIRAAVIIAIDPEDHGTACRWAAPVSSCPPA